MNVKTFEEVRQRFLEITFEERFDLIVAVANGGIIPAAMLNQRLNLDMQLLKLHLRDADQKQLYDRPRLLEEIRQNLLKQEQSIIMTDYPPFPIKLSPFRKKLLNTMYSPVNRISIPIFPYFLKNSVFSYLPFWNHSGLNLLRKHV